MQGDPGAAKCGTTSKGVIKGAWWMPYGMGDRAPFLRCHEATKHSLTVATCQSLNFLCSQMSPAFAEGAQASLTKDNQRCLVIRVVKQPSSPEELPLEDSSQDGVERLNG